jgi:hypothetical protein
MRINKKYIKFSRRDNEKGIIIPKTMTAELAEDIGIHLGDGSLYRSGSCKTLEFMYSGHIKEKDHMMHIANLKKILYNIQKVSLRQVGNELRMRLYSYAVAMFYTKVIGFPIGSKNNIGIPNIIMKSNNKEVIAGFLRGLIDTDFSLVIRKRNNGPYPTLQASFASRKLIVDLQELFLKLDIKSSILLDIKRFHKIAQKVYIDNSIAIHGFKRVNQWINKIGFSNKPKFEKKIMGLGELSC